MDRYFFDKRVIKKIVIKYAIIFAICIPFCILVNVFLTKNLSFVAGMFIDIAVIGIVVLVCELICAQIKKSKEDKQEKLAKEEHDQKVIIRKAKKISKKQSPKQVVKNIDSDKVDNTKTDDNKGDK